MLLIVIKCRKEVFVSQMLSTYGNITHITWNNRNYIINFMFNQKVFVIQLSYTKQRRNAGLSVCRHEMCAEVLNELCAVEKSNLCSS